MGPPIYVAADLEKAEALARVNEALHAHFYAVQARYPNNRHNEVKPE